MFISLKFKVIAITSTLVIALGFLFGDLSRNQLDNLFDAQQQLAHQRHERELQGLFQQSYNHLVQLSEFISALQFEEAHDSIESILDNQWDFLEINSGIANISLYSNDAALIHHWGEISLPEQAPQVVSAVIETREPTASFNCQPDCLLMVATPQISLPQGMQVLLLQLSLADILLAFEEVTGSSLGILLHDKNNTYGTSKPTIEISHWPVHVIALTNPSVNIELLQVASRQISFHELAEQVQTLDLIDSHDRSYQFSLIESGFSQQQEKNHFFLVISDVTDLRRLISGASHNYIRTAFSAVIILSLLIIWLLWRPMIRLRKQAELLPLLTHGKFEHVRNELTQNRRRSWIRDEIDVLDQSEIEVALQLEAMQSQIQHHTKELQDLVMHDSLTGLVNRRAIVDMVNNRLAQDNPPLEEDPFGLLFIDLDNFKRINDSMGHRAGDNLLNIVSKRFLSCVRSNDVVARLGGDEFCILVNHLKTESDSRIVAENILNVLKKPVRLEKTEVIVSASIGIVTAPSDGSTCEDLLQNADIAMYRAKSLGRNKFQQFDQSMNDNMLEQLSLEHELRQALINNEFRVFFQPKVDLTSNKICSFEALVRWQHPQRGLLTPYDFVGALEDTGLIIPLGEWVLLESCQAAKRWGDQGFSEISVAVNISSRQFQDPDLYNTIRETLYNSGLPPHLLELEITESVIMDDIDSHKHLLQELQGLGVTIAIDDFGTGYSSLSYLKTLPVDTLKVDRSFIRDIPTSSTDAEITSAIIAVAHKLKLKVVAEGIETVEQQNFLLNEHCDLGQGYLYSKPISENKMIELLTDSTQMAGQE